MAEAVDISPNPAPQLVKEILNLITRLLLLLDLKCILGSASYLCYFCLVPGMKIPCEGEGEGRRRMEPISPMATKQGSHYRRETGMYGAASYLHVE